MLSITGRKTAAWTELKNSHTSNYMQPFGNVGSLPSRSARSIYHFTSNAKAVFPEVCLSQEFCIFELMLTNWSVTMGSFPLCTIIGIDTYDHQIPLYAAIADVETFKFLSRSALSFLSVIFRVTEESARRNFDTSTTTYRRFITPECQGQYNVPSHCLP